MKFRINDKVRLLSDRTKIGTVKRIRRSWIRRSIPDRVIVLWNRGGREIVSTSDIELVRI